MKLSRVTFRGFTAHFNHSDIEYIPRRNQIQYHAYVNLCHDMFCEVKPTALSYQIASGAQTWTKFYARLKTVRTTVYLCFLGELGQRGPVTISENLPDWGMNDSLIQAAEELGVKHNRNYNSGYNQGEAFVYTHQTIFKTALFNIFIII